MVHWMGAQRPDYIGTEQEGAATRVEGEQKGAATRVLLSTQLVKETLGESRRPRPPVPPRQV